MSEDEKLEEIIADLKKIIKDERTEKSLCVVLENFEAYLENPFGIKDQHITVFLCDFIQKLMLSKFHLDSDLGFKKELWDFALKIVNYLEVETFKNEN